MNVKVKNRRPRAELPLWRLIVALDDAERVGGPDCEAARSYARLLRERLRKSNKEGVNEG